MKQLTEKQKKSIRKYLDAGWSRKKTSEFTGIPEGTISHYQNPHKPIKHTKTIYTHMFTKGGIAVHDNAVAEEAYRKAALCTIKKLDVLNHEPILKAFKILNRYVKYLIKEYKLEDK